MKSFYKFRPGEIVLVQFPFTDLSAKKVRPALIICDEGQEDVLMAPISTIVNTGRNDLVLTSAAYKLAALPVSSCVRYKKLFTLSKSLILKKASELKKATIVKIKRKIVKYLLRT